MKNKHTPGPFTVKPYGTDTGMFNVYAGKDGEYTCDLALIYERNMGPGNNEGETNAHLFAAAPDLLSALINLHHTIRQLDLDRSGWNEMDDAEKAIRKASGL